MSGNDKAKARIGEKRIMNCGQTATIIEYRKSNDIDVLFQDGTIVQHKAYASFINGAIKNPNVRVVFKDILGECVKMKNGQMCEVIRIENGRYIDVKFEDGTEVNHVRRDLFNLRQIRNPNYFSSNLVGKTKRMRNGEICEVIEDNGKTITVRFEDGTIVEDTNKNAFRSGQISSKPIIRQSILGKRLPMKCGMICEVIEELRDQVLYVKFDDGTIVKTRRDIFLNGKVGNPNYDQTSILGKSKVMNCGLKCEVIEDKGYYDITVKFEDGTIVEHVARGNFLTRKVAHPHILSSYSLPQALVLHYVKVHFPDAIGNYRPNWLRNPKTGRNLEIDIWIPSKKVGIEYDGSFWHSEDTETSKEKARIIESSNNINHIITIIENGAITINGSKRININLSHDSTYYNYPALLQELREAIITTLSNLGVFDTKIDVSETAIDDLLQKYQITFPKVEQETKEKATKQKAKKSNIKQKVKQASTRTHISRDYSLVGTVAVMNCGMECTVIEDFGNDNITVRFSDGTIVKERSRGNFKKGKISNPNYNKHSILGQDKEMRCGMLCKVIEDNGAHNIKVRFEDGTIIEHRTRNEFSRASIANPNLNPHSLLGKSAIMNCGMMCTVIEDNGSSDITVKFADGTIRGHVRRQAFRDKNISNPNLRKEIRNSLINLEKEMKCGMRCKVIEDKGCEDITVRFDDGTIVKHRSRRAFRQGIIDNPKLYSLLGITKIMNNGQKCTVIRDEGCNNIVIEFEDGTILEKQRRDTFRGGSISNPNYDPTSIFGQEKRMNCGLFCKVIEDNGSENITVQFENGTIKEKCTRHNFKCGKIAPPKKE